VGIGYCWSLPTDQEKSEKMVNTGQSKTAGLFMKRLFSFFVGNHFNLHTGTFQKKFC